MQLVLDNQKSLEFKAGRIAELLGRLYPKPPIPLDHGSTFQLLCAVLLSAQVRAAAGKRVLGAGKRADRLELLLRAAAIRLPALLWCCAGGSQGCRLARALRPLDHGWLPLFRHPSLAPPTTGLPLPNPI